MVGRRPISEMPMLVDGAELDSIRPKVSLSELRLDPGFHHSLTSF